MTSAPGGAAFKAVVAAAAVALAAYLVWALRSLIVPVAVGALLAYICRPLVAYLELGRLPRVVAVVLLLIAFVVAGLGIVNSVRAALPSEIAVLEMRVHALHRLNERYRAVMGLDESLTRGNRLYGLLHRDVDPVVDELNDVLALTPDERGRFLAARHAEGVPSDRLLREDHANVEMLARRARQGTVSAVRSSGGRDHPTTEPTARVVASPPPTPTPTDGAAHPATLGSVVSTWFIAPVVFVFLLVDTGEIKRALLRVVPNRLFEPALAVTDDLDRALGGYVRGLFLESCVLGATVAVFLAIVGVPLRWAIVIGMVTGVSNVVPYMGFAAALLSGLAYALLADDVRPLLPVVTPETFWLWVVGAVALAELLKNVVYEPVVLGGAVHLHPLVVVIGVIGGAILFGPLGMLLAIPTITVATAFISSTARHLRAYGLM
jgi:predicted PurR-regulated permease PerM